MATHPLARMLAQSFRAPAPRRPDPYRKQREEAKRWAADWGVEIESLHGGGFNVWPPKAWQGDDPLDGDHFCHDWGDVFAAVCQYRPTI